MSRVARIKADALAILFLVLWPFVYFFPVTLAQQVWFTTDIASLFYPFGVEYTRALSEGRMPLWTPALLAGFPLFAEGQIAAFYPVNLIAYKVLPAYYAISYGNLLHLAWSACGMYFFTRSMNLRVSSALFAGFLFSFNGFIFGHISHPTIIAALSWLPWLLLFQSRLFRALMEKMNGAAPWFFITTVSLGIQFFAGSIQIAFLNTLAFIVIACAKVLLEAALNWRARIRMILGSLVFPLLFGVGMAAIQLVPTGELIGFSVRSSASESFVTSYSLPLNSLAQFLLPFTQGEPSEATMEYWAYFGFLPFVLLLATPFLRPERQKIFYFIFALVALSLALGNINPLYSSLSRVPPFSFFRVPARFLSLFIFAGALLSAMTLDELSNRLARGDGHIRWAILFCVLLGIMIFLAYAQSLGFWQVWEIASLPLALVAIILVGITVKKKISRESFVVVALGLTILNIAAFAPPFLATIDSLTPLSVVQTAPRSLAVLQSMSATERVYTDLAVYPSLPALRASAFPNTALLYGLQSVRAFTSLAFGRHEAYFTTFSPPMFNLASIRYYLVPLEPRPETKRVTPSDTVFLDLLDHEIALSPTLASAIEISSFTEHAQDTANGTIVAELVVRFTDGGEAKFPLRVGIETADWDYDRKSGVKHDKPTIAHAFPAFWRSYGKTFEGHTFLARLTFPDSKTHPVNAIKLESLFQDVRFAVERITLVTDQSKTQSLATLAGKNNFSLAYLSDTVAIWENHNVLPRAFVIHSAEIANDNIAFARLQDAKFEPTRVVLLSDDMAVPQHSASLDTGNDHVEIIKYAPERVELAVQNDTPGYLLLADSWYPGWQASVDGAVVPIYRADVIFRAISIEPGKHTVVFEYHPMSLRIGAWVSVSSVVACLGVVIAMHRKHDSGVL